MIRLDTTTKTLKLVFTANADVVCSGVVEDTVTGEIKGFSEEYAVTSSPAVICAAPASADKIKHIDHVTIKTTGGANTVSPEIVNSSPALTSVQITQLLAANETLEYTHGAGWKAITSRRHVYEEVPGGSGTARTLANSPYPTSSLKLYNNGMKLKVTTDYTLSGTNITLVQDNGGWLEAEYDY